MDRHTRVFFACLLLLSATGSGLRAIEPPPTPPTTSPRQDPQSDRPETVVLRAIQSNPATAPYPIRITRQGGRVVLSGKVGTSLIHDIAVRTVIDLGYPVRDDLVIDTAEAHRVALAQTSAGAMVMNPTVAGPAPYFVYPPPLFGRVDDPFFGFEPPLVSFPPWTGQNSMERTRPAQAGGPGPTIAGPVDGDTSDIKGRIQLTVDAEGQVYLSGVVASDEDRRLIEAEARSAPGVSRVFSDLRVEARNTDTPPPPPEPLIPGLPEPARAFPMPASPDPGLNAPRARPAAGPTAGVGSDKSVGLAMARDTQALSRRVADHLAKRPVLAGLPLSVQSRGDVVTLSGKVPSAYEAMLAHRAVEQTPGVREFIDRLEFQLPDENHANPLVKKARPDDLEPYLTSQIRRHLGELAHVDRVRVRGDVVEVQGALRAPEDRNRVEATLRSMPLLREFRIEPVLTTD